MFGSDFPKPGVVVHSEFMVRSWPELLLNSKKQIGPKLAVESVSRGVRHCVAQHFQNAAEGIAKRPGRPILRPVWG